MQQTKIGPYKIKDELGTGGMGRVYRAFDPLRNREVALKVINLNAVRRFPLEEQEEVLKRFYHEVQMIAQLQHVAIVPLFDSGDDNGLPYMVMPLMRGGSLEMRLHDKQGNPQALPIAEIERILTWITPALDKMHAQKIVHRDLKPANILFDDENHP